MKNLLRFFLSPTLIGIGGCFAAFQIGPARRLRGDTNRALPAPANALMGENMFRRSFLQFVTMAGVSGLAPLAAVAASAGETVSWRVKGFSCITCATGLDTLLSREKGIISSRSTYPEGRVTVRFHQDQTTRPAIMAFIAELGFTVEA